METKQLQGLYEAYLQVYEQDDNICEEAEVAAEYFYDLGLNEDGIDYVIEEVGLDNFVDFVYDLFDDYTLTEARRSGRIEPVTKEGKPIGSLVKGRASSIASKRRLKEKRRASEEEASASKPSGMKAALQRQSEVVAASKKAPKGPSNLDRLARQILLGMERHQAATTAARSKFEKGMQRHQKANTIAGRLAGETGKALGKVASGLTKAFVGEDFEFVDDLSDNDLIKIMEELLYEEHFTLNECLDVLDETLLFERARVTSSDERGYAGSARVTKGHETERREATAKERQRKVRVGRIAQAASRAAENLRSTEGKPMSRLAAKFSSAKEKLKSGLKGLIGNIKGEVTGETARKAKAKKTGMRMRTAVRRQKAKAEAEAEFNNFKRNQAKAKLASRAQLSPSVGVRIAGGEGAGSGVSGLTTTKKAANLAAKVIAADGEKREGRKTKNENYEEIASMILEDLIYEGYANDYNQALDIFESFSDYEIEEIVESYLIEDENTYDAFDLVLEYLVTEGYADTNEDALVIMANMSEEWREDIVEKFINPFKGRVSYNNPQGLSPAMKAGRKSDELQRTEPGSPRQKKQTRRSNQLDKLYHAAKTHHLRDN